MEELERVQVLVMTYRIFASVLQQGYLEMGQVNLLVLDECHNAVHDCSLKPVFVGYDASDSRTRILGLTSSIVYSNCKPIQLAKIISNLESTLKSVIHSSNNILSALQ